MEKLINGTEVSSSRDYFDKELKCDNLFKKSGPFWHLFTPGLSTGLLFANKEEFQFGMNLMGICADRYQDVKITTFELMTNHLHLILSGINKLCYEMFNMYSRKMQRYLKSCGRNINLSDIPASLLPITDLNMLRKEIAYVNRNGYLVNSNCMPTSYPWGAGYMFFNPICEYIKPVPYNSLTIREKRQICHSADVELSDTIMVLDNMIIPSSFCDISKAESYFRDSHQYFNLLSKNYEAYSEIAKRLGDTTFISDEDIYSVVCSICIKMFNINKPNLLSPNARIEVAKIMHSDYNSNNKQIQRILKLNAETVETLFPKLR